MVEGRWGPADAGGWQTRCEGIWRCTQVCVPPRSTLALYCPSAPPACRLAALLFGAFIYDNRPGADDTAAEMQIL